MALRNKAPVPPDLDAVASIPDTTPNAGFGAPGHDFTLQAVIQMQGTLGELKSSISSLKSSVDGLKIKVDNLTTWKTAIVSGAAVLGVVCTALLFLITKAWDYVAIKVPSPTVISAPAPAAAPPVAPPK